MDSKTISGPVAPMMANGWPANRAKVTPLRAPDSNISIVPCFAFTIIIELIL